MQDLFDIMLMERLGNHPAWTRYLRESFAANKPWDRIARELLRADPEGEANRGAAFFLAKRLDHYGENPVDYPGLAADELPHRGAAPYAPSRDRLLAALALRSFG